jgi:phosphatidylglycerophosphatase A
MPAPAPKPRRTVADTFAYWTAVGAGAGLTPVAPGTFGAIEGVIIFLAASSIARRYALAAPVVFSCFTILNVALFFFGVWAANRVCRRSGIKDPSHVVIDEVSGQMIALTPVIVGPSVSGIIVGFVLFRTFDIFKPYPIRKLELLDAGLGVMLDDALAGVFAATLVALGRIAHLM